MKHFLVALIIALFLAGPAMGYCNLPSPRLVCAEYFASKVVVEATLIKVSSVHSKDDPDDVLARVYTLKANRLIRGHLSDVFKVYEGNDSGRATFDWKPGQ